MAKPGAARTRRAELELKRNKLQRIRRCTPFGRRRHLDRQLADIAAQLADLDTRDLDRALAKDAADA